MTTAILVYLAVVALFAYGFLSESLQTFLICWLVAGVVTLGTVGWWLHSKAEWSR